MQGRFSLLIPIVAAVAAVGVVGCGDDDEPALTTVEIGPTGPTGPSGALSKGEFTSEADDICAEAYTALANLAADGAVQRASIVSGMVNSLESLGRAPSDRSGFKAFLDSLDDAATAYENDDALAGDAALTEARTAATEYGLKDCSEQGKELEGGAGTEAPTAPTPAPTAPPPATTTPAPTGPPSGGTGTEPEGGGGGGGGASGGVSP